MWVPALHALRGIAALAVLILHAYWTWPAAFAPGIRHFYLCVDLFFILSGFVICLRYGEAFDQGMTVRNFMRKRFNRLAPVYYASGLFWLCAFTTLYASKGESLSVLDTALGLLRYGLGLDVWYTGPSPKMNPVAWSIMVEMFAYLLFALLFCRVRSRGTRMALSGLITVLGLAWLLCAEVNLNLVAGPGAGLRCLAGFFLGTLTCLIWQAFPQRGVLLLAGGVATLLAVLFLVRAPADFIVFCVIAAFMLLVIQFNHRMPPIPRPLMILGDISFSLYLWHFVVSVLAAKVLLKIFGSGYTVHGGEKFVLVPPAVGVLALVLYAAISVTLAYFSFRILEEKGLIRGKSKTTGAKAIV